MAAIAPPVNVVAPTVTPPTGGLYGAATVTTETGPSRIAGGMNLIDTNCGTGFGLDTIECETGEQEVRFVGDGPSLGTVFPSFQVWAADECDLGRTSDEAGGRAAHVLALKESALVERQVATTLEALAKEHMETAKGGTLEERIVAAVALAEGTLAGLGLPGVIHAPARLAAYVSKAGMAKPQGSALLSPLGYRWAFGGGYDEMPDRFYVTGPVVVRRTDGTVSLAPNVKANLQTAVAERIVTVGWECLTIGIDLTGGAA